MSDEIPEPDPTVGAPVIDIDHPLLEAHALQWSLRQRFLEAMREAVEVLRGITSLSYGNTSTIRSEIERAQAILDEALDPEAIKAWREVGYPLKSVPPEVEATGAEIDRLGAVVATITRYNIWGYDPENDAWVILDESLNADEANAMVLDYEDHSRVSAEYIVLPVGELPRPE